MLTIYNSDTTDFTSSGRRYVYKRFYHVQDINQDGKSDFVEVGSKLTININKSNNNSVFLVNFYENLGFLNNTDQIVFSKRNIDGQTKSFSSETQFEAERRYPFNFYENGIQYAATSRPEHSLKIPNQSEIFSPLIGNFTINNLNSQILLIIKGSIFKFSSYNVNENSKISQILQGNVKTEIEYNLINTAVNQTIYQPVKTEKYPYVEVEKFSASTFVSQLKQEFLSNGLSVTRKQDFRYRGLTSHLLGKGMLGFRMMARSSWYTDDMLNTKLWSGSEVDILNNALPIKEWSIKTLEGEYMHLSNLI